MSLASVTATAVRKPRTAPKSRLLLESRARRNAGLVATIDAASRRIGLDAFDPTTRRFRDDPSIVAPANRLEDDADLMIRRIAELHPLDRIPTWAEWFYSFRPIWTHREGGRLYLVVAGWPHDGQTPEFAARDLDDLITFARLVVIDDPA